MKNPLSDNDQPPFFDVEETLAGYGQPAQDGMDHQTGAPVDPGSNWLATTGVEPDELGSEGARGRIVTGSEDREDNGQDGPTQENGGLGLGDEEGLGRTGLSEAGAIGDQDSNLGADPRRRDQEPVTDGQDLPENQTLSDETVDDEERSVPPPPRGEPRRVNEEGMEERIDEQTGLPIEIPRD